ncbi:MAG: TolC family protein [Gemmataceae bacterium]|nr:TolC family protein [Gemmataceae bacterium]
MGMFARLPRVAVRLSLGLGLGVLGAAVFAQPPAPPVPRGHTARWQDPLPNPRPAPKDDANGVAEAGPELSLGECIAVALERQPSLRAAKESAAATQAGYRALTNFGTASTLLSPDIDIRKEQAKRGAMVTAAEYQKLHNEVVQDVTRLYYTAVYAAQQEELAKRVIARIDELVEKGRAILKLPPKDAGDFNLLKLQLMQNGLFEAQKLLETARYGRQRALAGLREVMAVRADTFPFRIKDKELPLMSREPLTAERVVQLALERRPELVLAAAGVDAFRLEVYAQGKIPFKRAVPTLSSGADIHAKEIPAPNRGADYRPGGIIPEMPTQLVGSKYDRVCRAMSFARKAEAVYDKAHNLVVLEAENAFIEYELAGRRLAVARRQFELSKDIQSGASEAEPIVKAKEQIVQAEVVAAKAQADYADAVHQYLLTLAALERVTAGGVWPKVPER